MESVSNKKRCLLISPLRFYSFHHGIASALEGLGYHVDILNEEFPANVFGRVLGKCALPILRFLTLRGLRKRLDTRAVYDLVLIIKGRGLGAASLRYLRTRARRIVGYNFDSFLYNPSPLDWYLLTDRYATFDIADAARYNLPLVHLFSAAPMAQDRERALELSIIQRVHSDRLKYAYRLLRALPPGARSYVFLFENSRLTFALGVLRRPLLYWKLREYISFKPLPYSEAMRVLGSSRVTFDYAHPRQSGITVRCFEAQSLGVAILTNNRYAVESGFFADDSIAYLPDGANESHVRAQIAELSESRPEPRCRTISDFLIDLLDEEKRPYISTEKDRN